MADSIFWQPDFDPSATFLVAGWPDGFTVRGVQPKRGQVFNKMSVSPTMLRSHYEARWLIMAKPLVSGGKIIGFVTPAEPAPELQLEAPTATPPKRSRAGRGVV